jgi:diguanylate cyclase (GGDEF)-like protein
LLFPDVPGSDEAERIAQDALAALAEPFEIGERIIDLGASIGVSLCPQDGTDLTSLMKAADIAMYCAKASGRSQARLYHPSLAAAFALRAPTPLIAVQPRAARITRA